MYIWRSLSRYYANVVDLSGVYKAAILAPLAVFALFYLERNVGLGFSDEGFLWYGTWRTSLGEVPLRDFQSYDPGRYYWGVAWSYLFGNGIIALRLSNTIFQLLGFYLGLLALSRVVRTWPAFLISSVILLLWMYPRHKLFEPSIAMAAVYFMLILVEKPSSLRYFIGGVFVGAVAFFGRNHGVYAFLAFLTLMIYLFFRERKSIQVITKQFGFWCVGILIGYSPMLFMLMLIPEYGVSFIESIEQIFRMKMTNLSIPVPWPWLVMYPEAGLLRSLNTVTTGLFFLFIPIVLVVMGIYVFFQKSKCNNLLIASLFVAVFYLHYAFSRPDLSHLAQSIHPFLIAGFSFYPMAKNIPYKIVRSVVLVLVFAISLLSVGMARPLFAKSFLLENYSEVNIKGDAIWINNYDAKLLYNVQKINQELVANGENVLFAPFWPGLYRIFEKKSPFKTIYFLLKESDERQNIMIAQLDKYNVKLIIVNLAILDGRRDRSFKQTHKILWKYISDNYERIQSNGLSSNIILLRRKSI